MENLWLDLRFVLRSLVRNPGFTVVAVLTLGLGLGATSAILTVINGVLLSALPYEDADRLVEIESTLHQEAQVETAQVSYADYLDFQARNKVFAEVAVYALQTFNLVAEGGPEVIRGELASASYFHLLGVQPVVGRGFLPEEDEVPGERPVVVVSHDLWQRRFGQDPALIGSHLQLSGLSYEVVGVMPRGFRGLTDRAEIWVPMMMTAKVLTPGHLRSRGYRVVSAAGRLRPGVSVEQAQAEMDLIARDLRQENPWHNKDIGVQLTPLREAWFGNLRAALWTILGAAGFVLLSACAGVSNLLLVRATARQREMATRAALGASRGRLIRQVLTESAVLTVLGCAVGLLLARWSTGLLVAASAVDFKSFVRVAIDPGVIGIMALVALLSTVVCGLVPAWLSARVELAASLKEGTKSSASTGLQRLQAGLVIAEVAMALVLLIGAGLMSRGFQRYRGLDLGFRGADLLTLRLDVREERFRGWPTLDFWTLARRVIDRVGALPGVEAVVLEGPGLPTDDWSVGFFEVEQSPDRLVEDVVFQYHHVTPGYFSSLGIPLLRGRTFTDGDKYETPFVVVVSQSLASRFWPDGKAIGRRLKEVSNSPWLEIVGVVADVRHAGLRREGAPGQDIYVPLLQFPPRAPATFNLLVQSAGADPSNLAPAVREALRTIDPNLPPYDVRTIAQRLDEQAARDRFLVLLMNLFALLALSLAMIGIYGVIAYIARQREREIGIRMALGAARRDVVRLVVGTGMRMALVGVALGVVAALILGRLLASFFYGLSATDPLVLAGAALLLVAVVALASYLPARRAAKLEPSRVLRLD